jgi:hypothetical protein
MAGDELGQSPRYGIAPRAADDIAEEKQFHDGLTQWVGWERSAARHTR